METVKLGLSEIRKIECDGYIFPDDVFKIENLTEYSDVDIIERYALEKMKVYAGKEVQLYLNGKLSTELLAVIKACAKWDIKLTIGHRNSYTGEYHMQEVTWKPAEASGNVSQCFELCRGRHDVPPEESLFEQISSDRMFDYEWMENVAEQGLAAYQGEDITVYITGLPSLYISVLNAAERMGISVTCMHYDNDTDEYFPQYMDKG